MRLTTYEKEAQREIEKWQRSDASPLQQAINLVMRPVDWVVERTVPVEVVDQASSAVEQFLAFLNDASEWTYDAGELMTAARKRGIEAETIEDLRSAPLEDLDVLAQRYFNENAVLAAVEGGGTGLGGAFLIAADIPLLFTINFRLIQQIGAAYGFPMRGPAFRPLILSIYNVAASGTDEARHNALREVTVAASALAHDLEYRGRVSGTFASQNRHLPREIAKNIVSRKILQAVPIAGAAVGAGINYWFTSETAKTAYMLFRALYLERKERL